MKVQYRYRSKTEEEKRNPYTDARETDFWFEAVMWAMVQGITNDTTIDTFDPSDAVTRGKIVMML